MGVKMRLVGIFLMLGVGISFLFFQPRLSFAENNILEDFEDVSRWWLGGENFDNTHSKFSSSTEQIHDGKHSGKLRYEFLPTGNRNRYITVSIPENTRLGQTPINKDDKIGYYVYGDGSGSKLFHRVVDKYGETFVVTVNYGRALLSKEWSYIETLPVRVGESSHYGGSGGTPGVPDYPVRLDALGIGVGVSTKLYSGNVFFDSISIIRPGTVTHKQNRDKAVLQGWIWYPEITNLEFAPIGTRYFRKILSVPDDVDSAWIQVAVDDNCTVYVNGKQIANVTGWQNTSYPINLHKGNNTIAVRAENWGGYTGLFLAGGVALRNGTKTSFFSDTSWKTSDVENNGWNEETYDDSNWQPAVFVAEADYSPWGYFLKFPSSILQRVEAWKKDSAYLEVKPDTKYYYYSGEPVVFGVKIENFGVKENQCLSYNITDYFGRQMTFGEKTIELKPGATTETNISIKLERLGFFKAEIYLRGEDGRMLQKVEIPFGVLPGPREVCEKNSPFGLWTSLHVHYSDFDEIAQLIKDAGADWIREGIDWNWVESTEGNFNWGYTDRFINLQEKHGFHRLLILGGVAGWVEARSDKPKPAEKTWNVSDPEKWKGDWANYIYKTVSRYKDKVKYWEIWNEPSGTGSFGEKMCDYAMLLKSAYQAAKRADPESKILVGSADGGQMAGIEKLYEAGGKGYFDIFNLHPYVHPAPPEKMEEVLKVHREFRKKHLEDDKEVWITEVGWETQGQLVPVSEEVQARYLVKSYVLALANRVDKIFWYNYRDTSWDRKGFQVHGLMTFDLKPRPAYFAYRTMSDQLRKTKFLEELKLGRKGIRAFLFNTTDGSQVMVIWHRDGVETLGLNVPPNIFEITDIMGNRTKVHPVKGILNFPVSQSPIFIGGNLEGVTFTEPLLTVSPPQVKVVRGRNQKIHVEIKNIMDDTLAGKLIIDLPQGWTSTPTDKNFQLKPAEKGDYEFSLVSPLHAKPGEKSEIKFLLVDNNGACRGITMVEALIIEPFEVSVNPYYIKTSGSFGITVGLKNNLQTELLIVSVSVVEKPEEISFQSDSLSNIVIKPQGDATCVFEFKEVPESDIAYDFAVKVTDQDGSEKIRSKRMNFRPCPQLKGQIKIDGFLDEWQEMVPIQINKPNQWEELIANSWQGEKDLSGLVYTAWDTNYFYLAAEIKDDIYSQLYIDSDIWLGDSIQFAFDTQHDATDGYDDNNDYEYAIALTKNGPQIWRSYGPLGMPLGRVEKAKMAVNRSGDKIVYEIAIPFEELKPLVPVPGRAFGFSFLINDNDGDGRKGWLEWFSGIGRFKAPTLFGDLIFISPKSEAGP